jgi:hypothetical protein
MGGDKAIDKALLVKDKKEYEAVQATYSIRRKRYSFSGIPALWGRRSALVSAKRIDIDQGRSLPAPKRNGSLHPIRSALFLARCMWPLPTSVR